MLSLKKTAVAVLALSSSGVFAGAMGPVCSATNVTIPCASTGWDIGLKALYLRPAYAGTYASVGVANDANGNLSTVGGAYNWAWGFKLEGSYHFGTGSDFNLNWYHLGNKTKTVAYAGRWTSPFGAVNALNIPGANITSALRPYWDAVNLEYGQHIDLGDNTDVRLHGGVQWARIKTNQALSINGVEPLFNLQYQEADAYRSQLSAIGPRFGLDGAYNWSNGFSVYGNAAAALLVGRSTMSGTFVNNLGAFGVPANSVNARVLSIVPEAEMKGGIAWTAAMAQGDFTIDLGWMWVNYWNAQTMYNTRLVTFEQDSFGVQGPYLGVKWMGNVA